MPVRVLMVDDSLLVRDVLRHHLECLGCEVVAEAENTLQALDLFRTVAPTLIILDVSVAHTGGIGALALFKMMRREQPGIPILVVSASAYPELRESLLREGALDYVLKPFDASSLAQVCKSVLKMFPESKLVTTSRSSSREANLDSTASSKPNHGELRRP